MKKTEVYPDKTNTNEVPMKLSSLLLPGEYLSSFSTDTVEVESVAASHTAVVPGCLFICLRGMRYDTHCLLSAVAQAGAVAALVRDRFA